MRVKPNESIYLDLISIVIATIIFVCVPLVHADYPIMSQHYAADPTAVEWNGRIWAYCSNDEENGDGTGYIMDSIACFSTADLKNWTDHGVVFDADELSSWYSGTAWAPCIVYNNGQFYLYFGDAGQGIGVVTSTSPTGPFTAPKNDLVVRRGVTPGADSSWLFDPGVFVDDDGTPHLYFGGSGADQCRYIELNPNMYDSVGSAITIPFSDFFEASHMHKYNGTYYLSYADNYNDSTPSSQIAYMTSSSPTGPFTYQGVALPQPPDNYGNNNHHTFFTFQGDWYCIYHNRTQAGIDGVSTTEHRNICLDRMYYNPDGTIQTIVHTQDGLAQLSNLNPFVRVEGETLNAQSGLNTEVCSEGGMNITDISNGDWIRIRGVDFLTGANSFEASVASIAAGASIELRLDSVDGTLVGTCVVPNTGGTQTWASAICPVSGVSGVHDLYLKFIGSGDDMFNLDWWQFYTDAIAFATVDVNPSTTYQTIEGIGGALCFYNGWVTAHPYKQEIYDHAFSGLNLSMLRLANWWRGTDGQDNDGYEFVSAANQRLSNPIPILMTSWSPPANLKSNGEVGNGGTLVQIDGEYDYPGFANYWYDSLQDYIAHGVTPTWIGIQNEPDWTATYDSCRFNPSEASWNGASYASFALAQDAVYNRLQSMTTPPKLLGPECVGLYGNGGALKDYMQEMNPNTFYGIAHHLYGGSTDGTPDGYNAAFTSVLNASNTLFPGKPRFMTEFGDITGLIPCANLIHNSLVVEQVSGYNHWCLIWPGEIGLVEIEFPWGYYGEGGEWTNPKGYWLNPSYWSMKHFSYFVQPGYKRVQATSSDSDVLVSSFLSPDDKKLVTVFINRNDTDAVYTTLDAGSFQYDQSSVYQTEGENHWVSLGAVSGSQVVLPPSSITTVVLYRNAPLSPTGLIATAVSDTHIDLTWTASAGATSYNIKRSTTSGGPYTTIASDIPTAAFGDTNVTPGTSYYYVVSANTGEGESAESDEATAVSLHAYLKFDETSGTFAADATSNGWDGTLINGATWTTGKSANAVNLDGNDDYVTLPTGVVDGLTDVTISMWVYLNSASQWSRVFDFGNDTNVYMFITPNANSGAVRFAITTSSNGGEDIINGTQPLPTGSWTQVAVTLGGGTGVLYVDGQEVGRNSSMTLNPDSLGATVNNKIGWSQWTQYDPTLDGQVDEFRIYPTALSGDQMETLYALQIPTSIPSVPTGLVATAASSSQIDLIWNVASGATNYNIKRAESSGGPYTLIASVGGTSYSETELDEKTTYYYVISAVNALGESVDSTEADATTLTVPPAAPTGLAATSGDENIALNWDANGEADVTGYNVYRSSTSGGPYTLQNVTLLATPEYTDTNVTNYTLYYYVVTAVDNDTLESAYSEEVIAMPAETSLVQLSGVDFETGLDSWFNNTTDDTHDWTRNSGSTLTPNTGPYTGANGSTWYLYFETSPAGAGSAGDTAIFESPAIHGLGRILTFYYHMYGEEIGTLSVDVYDGSWHNDVWSLSGQQHTNGADEYAQATVDLTGYTGLIKIRLRAEAAGGPRGDIAIDDIVVTGAIVYGDMNSDNIVNESDLPDFAIQWLQTNCDLDLNGDCLINLYEFAKFSENWMDNSF